jgi:hypothetical protein
MLPDLLVHIGFHKTASTWLQRELFDFDSRQFCPLCPDRMANAGKFIGRHFVRDRESRLLSSFDLNTRVVRDEVAGVLEQVDLAGRIPVISYERLSGNPHAGSFDARLIADRIRAAFPRARMFCVIREQADMIVSTYFQYLKIGGTDSLRNYLARSYDGRRPGCSPSAFVYVDLIRYYREIFPPERVLVLPYEMLRDNATQFLQRIGDFTGTDIAALADRARVSHNPRREDFLVTRFPLLNLFRCKSSVNNYSPLYLPGAEYLLRGVDALIPLSNQRHQRRVRRRVEAIIGDRYAASNRELSELIGIDLSRYGYRG